MTYNWKGAKRAKKARAERKRRHLAYLAAYPEDTADVCVVRGDGQLLEEQEAHMEALRLELQAARS